MRDYRETINEICLNTEISINDVFCYDETPLENLCSQIFNFIQYNLDEDDCLGIFNIAPARFFFNNNQTVNAWAWLNKGYSLLSINIGTVLKFKQIFLDDEDVFSKDKGLLQYRKLNDAFKRGDTILQETMFHTSFMFLMYHEAAHLIQKSSMVYDVFSEGVTDKFNIYNHQIETDADIFAAAHLGQQVLKIWGKLDKEYRTKDYLINLISVIVSSISVNRFFYLSQESIYMYTKEKSHPHILIRINTIIEVIIDSILQKIEVENKALFKQLSFEEIGNECFRLLEIIVPQIMSDNIFGKFTATSIHFEDQINEYGMELISMVKKDENMSINKWNNLKIQGEKAQTHNNS